MIITLLSDFGTSDGYAGEVKGVLLRLAPGVSLVDVTHDIPPGDVSDGAYALGRVWAAFPPATVHLAVVDPGVGTERRALAVEAGGHRFVGPDNGLLTPALRLESASIVAVTIPETASRTFHARDVFAPAAARLVCGAALADLGRPAADPVLLPEPRLMRQGAELVGRIVHVDRFGTLVSNLPGQRVAAGAAVRLGVYELVLRNTFGDVEPGRVVAFVGSGDTVEIAVRDGRADAALGLARGAEVRATARAL